MLELYRNHPQCVATLILADTYAGWKGSLPDAELKARVAGARQMLAAPAAEFDPTLPGLFAAGPPAEFAGLMDESSSFRTSIMSALAERVRAKDRELYG